MLDMDGRDLLIEDKSSVAEPVFDTVWGNLFEGDEKMDMLICNIIIPSAYRRLVEYADNEMTLRFKSAYKPDTRHFRIRPVALEDGRYSQFDCIREEPGVPAFSYALSKNIAAPIAASVLPFIDIDGEFVARFMRNEKYKAVDKAYVYSSKQSDIAVDYSDSQASQLLSICNPGNLYRYPLTGVGITRYLNAVIQHSDLDTVLEEQFDGDGKPLQSAEFDNTSGQLDVFARPEADVSDTDSPDEVSIDFFTLFDDDYVRRNTVLMGVPDIDFIKIFDRYTQFYGIILFTDYTTEVRHICDKVVPGRFDSEGNIVDSDEYFVVSTTLDADTVIMFDDELESELTDCPVFIVNDVDESRLYTSLVNQPNWITEDCHKCFVLKKRALLQYMVRQDRYRDGKGLYVVPQTSSNIKNMLGLVQDSVTGKIKGLVSDSTNISDITLDEITRMIYSTQIN